MKEPSLFTWRHLWILLLAGGSSHWWQGLHCFAPKLRCNGFTFIGIFSQFILAWALLFVRAVMDERVWEQSLCGPAPAGLKLSSAPLKMLVGPIPTSRMVWGWRDPKDHPVPTPAMGRDTFNQTRFPRASSSLASNTLHFLISVRLLPLAVPNNPLGYIFLISNPNLPWHSFRTFPQVPSLIPREKRSVRKLQSTVGQYQSYTTWRHQS